jgi:hypothetical protein
MKLLTLTVFLFLGIGGIQKIAEVNEHSNKAAEAFRKSNFTEAIKNYEFLVYEIGDNDPRLILNLAHAYRLNNQAEKATKAYQKCVKNPDANLRSKAWENLATLDTKIQNYTEALTNYKRALVANPKNEQARYNYELLKKYLREHPEEQNKIPPPQPEKKQKQEEEKKKPQEKEKTKPQNQKQDQNGDQQKETNDQKEPGKQNQQPEKQTNPQADNQQKQEKPQGGNGKEKEQKSGKEKGREEGQDLTENEENPRPEKPQKSGGKDAATGNENRLQTQYDRLRKLNISPEQAEQMLNAMRASEQQYLQQLPKKPTKIRDRSKPDW